MLVIKVLSFLCLQSHKILPSGRLCPNTRLFSFSRARARHSHSLNHLLNARQIQSSLGHGAAMAWCFSWARWEEVCVPTTTPGCVYVSSSADSCKIPKHVLVKVLKHWFLLSKINTCLEISLPSLWATLTVTAKVNLAGLVHKTHTSDKFL